ncbi:MAG: transposase zinc-binding domain-containing protein [Thermoanaerobaculia bacterium]
MEERYEEVKGLWEDRFEASYGRWRGVVDAVVYAFLDRGGLEHGFARTFCDTCKRDYLLAFSCSRRGFCPSCAAKRGVICGAFLREEVVEEVGHCLWTFTVPKLLRPSCPQLRYAQGGFAAATAGDTRPGMVAAAHTASSDLRWLPHVHALVSRGGWDRTGVTLTSDGSFTVVDSLNSLSSGLRSLTHS